jgi:hypothetical protein
MVLPMRRLMPVLKAVLVAVHDGNLQRQPTPRTPTEFAIASFVMKESPD